MWEQVEEMNQKDKEKGKDDMEDNMIFADLY